MSTKDWGTEWESVIAPCVGRDVRRLRVPGGWLVQVGLLEDFTNTSNDHPDVTRRGWHPPVFVPDTAGGGL